MTLTFAAGKAVAKQTCRGMPMTDRDMAGQARQGKGKARGRETNKIRIRIS